MVCWITSPKSCTDSPDSKWLTPCFSRQKFIGSMQIIQNQPIIVIGNYSSKRRNFASKARMILPFPKRKFSKHDYSLFSILKSELSGTIRQSMAERNHPSGPRKVLANFCTSVKSRLIAFAVYNCSAHMIKIG